MSVAEIKSAVAAMPQRYQAELAVWLLDLLPAPASSDEDDRGIQEAQLRREELDSCWMAPLLAGDLGRNGGTRNT